MGIHPRQPDIRLAFKPLSEALTIMRHSPPSFPGNSSTNSDAALDVVQIRRNPQEGFATVSRRTIGPISTIILCWCGWAHVGATIEH
jgi:hypothetical protein